MVFELSVNVTVPVGMVKIGQFVVQVENEESWQLGATWALRFSWVP